MPQPLLTRSVPASELGAIHPEPPVGYELLRRLGGGAMGDVFLAREETSQREVAMKFLRSPGSPTAVDRFLAEVRALGRLNHPHIIRVLETEFYRHQPFFTMEYAPGGTLAERVTNEGPLDSETAARLTVTVARALQAAHEAKIWHRDLKPSNILLDKDGIPRVSDFGLAKLTDQEDTITVGSGPLGTPSYMPPEQISRRYGPMGPASDVYGLGATLYHLVTGRAPFLGATPAETLSKVERDPPDRPRALRPELPITLEAIIVKCLEKRQTDRYASPAELANDLERYLTHDPGQHAQPLTRRRRLKRWVSRRRGWVAGGAVVLLAVVAAFIAGFVVPDLIRADPLKQMQRDLAAGKPVTLIGETGLPKWHRWAHGAPELGYSTNGDGTCSFETAGKAFLELCPDPMVVKYVIRAEIRLAQSKLGNTPGAMRYGVYFGHASSPGNNGAFAQEMLDVTWNDTPLLPVPKNQETILPEAHLRLFLQFLDPAGGKSFTSHGSLDHTPFWPATQVPGPWRMVEIQITPEGIECRWREPDGTMKLFSKEPGSFLQEQYAGFRTKIDSKSPNHGTALPNWSPRMPIGIWNNQSAIDIRNVTITPLP